MASLSRIRRRWKPFCTTPKAAASSSSPMRTRVRSALRSPIAHLWDNGTDAADELNRVLDDP